MGDVQAPGDQRDQRRARRRRQPDGLAVADHRDTGRAGVEALDLGADDVLLEAAGTALVDLAVGVDEVVVSDVLPAQRARVVRQDRAHDGRRLGPAVAVAADRVVHEHQLQRRGDVGLAAHEALVGAPRAARGDERRVGHGRGAAADGSRPAARVDEVDAQPAHEAVAAQAHLQLARAGQPRGLRPVGAAVALLRGAVDRLQPRPRRPARAGACAHFERDAGRRAPAHAGEVEGERCTHRRERAHAVDAHVGQRPRGVASRACARTRGDGEERAEREGDCDEAVHEESRRPAPGRVGAIRAGERGRRRTALCQRARPGPRRAPPSAAPRRSLPRRPGRYDRGMGWVALLLLLVLVVGVPEHLGQGHARVRARRDLPRRPAAPAPRGPGLSCSIPFVDRMVRVDLRTVTLQVPRAGRDLARQRPREGHRGRLLPRHPPVRRGRPGRGLHGGDLPDRPDDAALRARPAHARRAARERDQINDDLQASSTSRPSRGASR